MLFAMNMKPEILLGLALLSALAVPFESAAGADQPQEFSHGHVRNITKKLSPLGRLDGSYKMHVAIGLPLRNREQLTNLLENIYNPSSPNFRHFLTANEFAASFGPSAEDYQSVIDFAKAHHLKLTRTHTNRTLVDVSGSVADIENAFHVHLQRFKHPKENRNFFAPDAEPSLYLNTPVLAISGLDNYVKPTPKLRNRLSMVSRPNIQPDGVEALAGPPTPAPTKGLTFAMLTFPTFRRKVRGSRSGSLNFSAIPKPTSKLTRTNPAFLPTSTCNLF